MQGARPPWLLGSAWWRVHPTPSVSYPQWPFPIASAVQTT
jgi:hypothetical protein